MFKGLFFLFFLFSLGYSQNVNNGKGKITYVENNVKKKNLKDSSWLNTANGDIVKSGEKIRTYKKSRAEVNIKGLTVVRLAPNTTLDVEKLYEESEDKKVETTLNVEDGEIWSNTIKVHDNMEFDVNTDVAGMAIKGTIFRVKKQKNGNTKLKVYKGAVAISNNSGKANLNRKFELDAPKEISGPREVSVKEWTEIIKNMQEIEISKDGLILVKKNFDFSTPDENTQWAKWNKKRDSLLIVEKKRKER